MVTAKIVEHGLLPCFPPGLCGDDGAPVNAEVSAVVVDGDFMLLASDKPVPGEERSSVFAVALRDHRPVPGTVEYLTTELIKQTRKFEDFALSADGAHVLASTGFDRVARGSTDQDQYNNLLIWPRGNSAAARVVAASGAAGVRSSVGLRQDLEAVLGAPYFKIEGLAAIPGMGGGDDQLLFGIREVGADHADFDYVCKIVAAPYKVTEDALHFTGAFRQVYDFDPEAVAGVRFAVGLSSLEHDPHNGRLLLLTSFETVDADGNERIGGYLWAVSLDDFAAGRAPALVHGEDGSALEFANKAEGLAVLDESHVFVVYDEDRNTALAAHTDRDRREPHEAPYTILTLD